MAYSPTNWVNNSTPAINAANLNKIETGIDEAHDCQNIVYTPYGDIIATNVQAAISELEDEKESTTTNHASRHVTGGGDTIANAGAGGSAGLMTDADKTKLDGVETLADVTDATNVADAGALMKTTYNAQSIVVSVTDDTPVSLTVDTSELVGRTAGGNIDSITMTEARAILAVEENADVTDATNVAAAGAVMDGDFTAADEVMVGTGVGAHGQVTLAASQFLAKKAAGTATNVSASEARTILDVAEGATKYPDTGEQAFLDADHTKLNGIEALADKTDATNVASAGAMFDLVDDASPQLAGDLDLVNYEILADTTPGTNLTGSGIKGTFTNGNTGSVAFGDLCYMAADGDLEFADADADTSMPGLYMALATITAASSGEWMIMGVVRNDTWNWTIGPGVSGLIYASVTATTGNTLSQTAPSATGDQVQVVGHAISADIMMFNPSPVMVEIA